MDTRPTDDNRIYTLDDLSQWDTHADAVSLAVLGHPITHSVSPAMHNAALSLLTQSDPAFAHWRYYKFDVEPPMLGTALEKLARNGFLGLNLTLPLKVDVLTILKDALILPAAHNAQAANTLLHTKDGWRLDNTDIAGLLYGIKNVLNSDMRAHPCVILGTGGAARAAVAAARQAQAPSIQIRSRTPERAEQFCAEMKSVAQMQWADASHPLPENALVINATPMGLKPADPCPLNRALLQSGMKIFDMTYGKQPSQLLLSARERNLPYCDGLPMLAAQGFYALAQWVRAASPSTAFPETTTIPLMLAAARTAVGIPPSHD